MDTPEHTADPLEELVAECMRRHSLDGTLPLEELCARHPGHAGALRERVRQLDRFGLLCSGGGVAPQQVGPYRILEVLGEGGMGTVYLAEREAPMRQRVALKLIKLGMDSKAVVARFEAERQALALMRHDGIAKVFDCGVNERGQPFFVMEFVEGVPLTRYCDEHRLSLPDRLRLLRQVCDAVQHAHQKGVVHRDLKPGNVLVGDDAGRTQVKIIDFGLAKAMGQQLVEATLLTAAGQVVGTPEYMAPEQADPANADIDTRADVYSLGVMLYEVLTGQLPFSGAVLRQKGLLELQRVLRDVAPPRPSTQLSQAGDAAEAIAERRRTSAAALYRALRHDLDWVVSRAIDKDRDRRYESADALAADLQRYLDHEPLLAGPPSTGYRLRLFVRKHRGRVLAASIVLMTLIGGGIATFVQYLRAEAKVREFDQLAGFVQYEDALASEAELYPPWPRSIPAMEAWLRDDAGRLLRMRPEIERTVQDLETRTRHGRAESQQFLHDTLVGLLGKLDTLQDERKVAVEQRLGWARRIESLTLTHPNARHTWPDVRAAIAANARYAGCRVELRDEDVVGLVPIGANPVTGLWEFLELRSAWDGEADPRAIEIPRHSADGTIAVDGSSGIVFVLLPGGTFTMGAQKADPSGPNYDPWARDDEMPHAVTLAPFFLARHELTRGQWSRLTCGEEPSGTGAANADSERDLGADHAYPVLRVTWTMCDTLLRRHGLALPTEAQWEYGCRAGTATPWWSGATAGDLAGCANVLDQRAERRVPSWGRQHGDFDDGHINPAPVGSYRANAFGLVDVHGNLQEWCVDGYGPYGTPRDGDGLCANDDGFRVMRGGAFRYAADHARSARRARNAPGILNGLCGVRPARSLRP